MKKFTFLLFSLAISLITMAQKTEISGIVKDPDGETVIGASVVLENGIGTVTDINGAYKLATEAGEHTLTISFIGFETIVKKVTLENKSISVNANMSTKKAREIKEYEVVSNVAKQRETPVAFSNINRVQLREELATRDITAVMNSAPGVYATEGGGGAGDSRITVRGFDQRNVAVMLDGVPLNDMENGQVYFSNLFFPIESVQLQRGLGASKLAVASVGGTMNMITSGIDPKFGGSVGQSYGSGNSMVTKVRINSGYIKDKFGVVALFARRKEDGVADQTWADIWSYFIKFQYRAEKHLFSLSASGAPQKHGQRSTKLGIAELDRDVAVEQGINVDSVYGASVTGTKDRGVRYNKNWGTYYDNQGRKQFLNERVNEYHKPLINFTHSYNISEKLYLSNVVYLSKGMGGGTGLVGTAPNYDNTGQSNFQAIYNSNDTTHDKIYSTELTKSSTYIRESFNDHLWYGLISSLKYNPTEKLSFLGGIDLRNYTGDHYQEVYDLIGGDYAIDKSNINQPKSGVEGDPNNSYSMKMKGDKIGYDYKGKTQWQGLFLQTEYKEEKWSAFITFSGSRTSYQRIDYYRKKDVLIDNNFYPQSIGYGETLLYNGTNALIAPYNSTITTSNDTTYVKSANGTPTYITNASAYTIDSPEARAATTQKRSFKNFTLKGGLNFNLNKQNNVYVNLGYLTIAPKLNNVFDFNNREYYNYRSSEVKSAELGYGLNLKALDIKINLYYTYWLNRPADFSRSTTNSAGETVSYQINGIDQLHKGIETELHYQIIPQVLYLDLAANLGDYRYKSADTLQIFNEDGTLNATLPYSAKNVHVGNAAQNQFSSAIKYNLTRDLWVKARYTYFAKNYANFDPANLSGDNADRDSWRLPNYEMLDLFAGFRLKGYKDLHYSFNLGIINLLNLKYITDADNGAQFDANTSLVYMALGRRFTASVLIDF